MPFQTSTTWVTLNVIQLGSWNEVQPLIGLKLAPGYYCGKTDRVVGRIVEALWNFKLEKPLSVDSSMGCCVGACRMLRAVQTMEAMFK